MRAAVPIISDSAGVDELCSELARAGRFAFDTEFIRDDTFDANLCLVQVACGDRVTLIDPTEGADLAPFWSQVCDPAVLKIVHAGKEDFEVCLRAAGKPPRNVFDLQVAAGFLGLGYPLSLSRLVSAVLQKRVSKGQTLTNWMRRPLTTEQIEYAVDDVAFLPAAHRTVDEELNRLKRSDWAREEFARFEDAALYRPAPADRLTKFKGASKLDGRGLAALERLIGWREQWARDRNRPARAMIRDDILVEIARRRPTRAEQLEVMRGFPQARNPKIIQQILEMIATASGLPAEELPQPREVREEPPMLRVVLDVLSAFQRSVCVQERMDSDLVGSQQKLRDLLDHLAGRPGEAPSLLTGWRGEFIGRRMVDLLEGRCELHLSGFPREPRLEVITHRKKAAGQSNPA